MSRNPRATTKEQEAQLSLGKTSYSPYSSYCSTDLEGHPRSMFFMSSKKAYNMPLPNSD